MPAAAPATPAPSAAAACWACGAPGPAVSLRLSPLPYFECAACGFAQRDAPVEVARQHYLDDGYGRDRAEDFIGADWEDRLHDARVRVDLIRGYAPPGGTVLDVGTAGGAFVLEAGAAGYAARGIEPTPSFAAHAREQLGLDVQTASLEGADLPDRALDVVTLWHVLEHLEDPLVPLRRARETLRPGGLIAIEVPNAGSGAAHRRGPDWPLLEPEVHVGQYTPLALGRLLERAGFTVRRIETLSALLYLPRPERLLPHALAHRVKWRGTQKELLRGLAAAT